MPGLSTEDRRLVRSAAQAERYHPRRGRRPQVPTEVGQLVLRLRERSAYRLHHSDLHGIMLALIYVPSAGEAWNSLQYLNHGVPLGWYLRALHGWGSNFMVAIVLIHMVQVAMFGAYKFPRELTWIVGVFLLLMTLGMAFTGQVMRFDQDAYWGLGIGASICGRVPFVGAWVVHLLLGGPIIAGDTLSRFFAFHVFVISGLLLAFVSVHLLMVLKLGINEWPMPGRLVRRSTYIHEYEELAHKEGMPFVPGAIWKDMIFAAFIIFSVMACAADFGLFGPSGQPDPTIVQTVPKPDYFFQWLYALLAFLPPADGNTGSFGSFLVVILVSGSACRSSRARARNTGRVVLLLCSDNLVVRSGARHPYTSCQLHAVESDYGRVERRSRSGALFERSLATGTNRRGGFSGEAMP